MSIGSFIRYFAAVRPDLPARVAMGRVRDSAGPFQSSVADHRLHNTLGIIAELPEPDEAIGALARRALGDYCFEAFPMVLQRLVLGDGIGILLPGKGGSGIRKLQASLFERLGRYGVEIRHPKRYRPHTTLGYGPRRREVRAIPPISWVADHIVLIESWVGKGIHRTVGTWPLLPPAQYSFDFN